MTREFDTPRQLLPRDSYFDDEWLARERRTLFDRCWVWAGLEADVAAPGDFLTTRILDQQLFVLRDDAGALRAFHNVCRHRGCEVVEGKGNVGKAIRCPYHRWTYAMSGALRTVPNEDACFGSVERERLSLHAAAVGVHGGMVYVNPHPEPPEPFEEWIAGLDEHAWPHDLGAGDLKFAGEVTYEMRCNWKVFYENAVDGYHLGYLHDRTLGPLYPDRNVWRRVGRHAVWYSTERDGAPRSSSVLTERFADGAGAARLPGHESAAYPGVVMLFPLTILSPSPWGFYVSILEPVDAETTRMRAMSWEPSAGGASPTADARGSAGFSPVAGGVLPCKPEGSGRRFDVFGEPSVMCLDDLATHPLESGNFQIEDMWICEKIQRNLHSPKFEVGPLADGPGAESPITHFQQSVLDHVGG